MGPGATGILQSALGNLPELFVCIFALKAGLSKVVQAALIGSILGNSLLVFGLALFFGGLKNGTQRFKSGPPKMIATLMILAFGALAIPTLTHMMHTKAETHLNALDIFVAIILLILFGASTYFFLKQDKEVVAAHDCCHCHRTINNRRSYVTQRMDIQVGSHRGYCVFDSYYPIRSRFRIPLSHYHRFGFLPAVET